MAKNSWGEFRAFLKERGLKLFPWQEKRAREILSGPVGSGRSFVIRALYEFDTAQAKTEPKSEN